MFSPLVIGFYGASNSGKTTILTELIKQLKHKGYMIGTIKQTDKPLSMDTPGKDTWKHKEAGASLVVFSSTIETTFLMPTSLQASSIIEKMMQLQDFDIIFVEGANDPEIPKIRFGSKALRKNTLFTYDGDFNNLLHYILHELKGDDT